MGLATVVLEDPTHLEPGFAGATPAQRNFDQIDRAMAERRLVLRALQCVLTVLFAAAAWRSSLVRASILGAVLVFAFTPAGSYYWVMLCAVALAGARGVVLALLCLSAALYTHQLVYPPAELEPFRIALMAWGLFAILIGWSSTAAFGRRLDRSPVSGG